MVDTNLLKEYKNCRNKCSNNIKAEHRKLMGHQISESSTMQEIWHKVNSILSPRNASKNLTVKEGNSTLEDPVNVANAFNNFFKENIEKLDHRIYKSNTQDPIGRLKASLKDRKLAFSLQPVDVNVVLEVLTNLKPKTSSGMDGITSEVLKMCKEELAGPITIIINRSISSGVFPEKWKMAKVAPLLKKGDPLELKNYRPIAVLSVAGMVLEKVVADQIERHFESNRLFGQF